MPKRRQLKLQHDALVLQARAGLIPESDHLAYERRLVLDKISRVVKAYGRASARSSGPSHDAAVADILADLRHYCDSESLAFDELDGAARENYLEDVREWPPSYSRLP